MTIFRRGKRHRVQVNYNGRRMSSISLPRHKADMGSAARIVGDLPALRPPPFMQVLQDSL
jgi:hypothetical protein